MIFLLQVLEHIGPEISGLEAIYGSPFTLLSAQCTFGYVSF